MNAITKPNGLVRAYDARIDDVSKDERTVVAVINTASIDRYQSVIDPKGIDLKAYKTNPVVLWEHGYAERSTPIGRNMWIQYRKDQNDIVAKTKFHKDDFCQGLFELYQEDILRAFSVNVLPRMDGGECTAPTAAELKKRPELASCTMVYRSTELQEYSAVSVPGNPEALATAVSRGMWLPNSLQEIARKATAPKQEAPQKPDADLPRLVGRSVSQAYVEMCNRLRGQVAALRPSTLAQDTVDSLLGRV